MAGQNGFHRIAAVLMVSSAILAATPVAQAARFTGQCFWYNLTLPPGDLMFTDSQLTSLVADSAIGNCSTDDVVTLAAATSPRPHGRAWLVMVASGMDRSANETVQLSAISRFILTSWQDVALECSATPAFDSIDKSRILVGLEGDEYSVKRRDNACLLALTNSTNVVVTGVAFQKCVSSDAQAAALEVRTSSEVYVVDSAFRNNFGPALAILNSSAAVRFSAFQDNIRFGRLDQRLQYNPAQSSSGMVVAVGDGIEHVVAVHNCTFSGNVNAQTELDEDAQGRGGHAAGLSVLMRHASGNPTVSVTDSTFVQNAARQFGGGVLVDFMDTRNATVLVNACTFSENGAETLGGGLLVYFASNSSANTIHVENSIFQGNTAGMGGAIAIALVSVETLNRTFDTLYFKVNSNLANETFPVAVPAENFISFEGCRFNSNLARGSGNAVAVMMQLSVTTSPLPASINNCTFLNHTINAPSARGVATNNSALYERMMTLIFHPRYADGKYLQRLFAWSSTKCILFCYKIPVQFGMGETKFISNFVRSMVIKNAAVYIEGRLVVSGNINRNFDKFNLESYGAGIFLTGSSQVYVANTSDVVISDNFAGFGAGLYSLTNLASVKTATSIDDVYSHRCFVIFGSPAFSYPAAASESLATFTFENNTAWKGAGIYASSMLDCASWWRSRKCTNDYPKSFRFRNNTACNYNGFPSFEECRQIASALLEGNPTACGTRPTREALDRYRVYCPSVATDAYQEHWQLSSWSSDDPTALTFSPGQKINVEAILTDQNCNPSELNTKLQSSVGGLIDFHHLHFEVIDITHLSFVGYATDYQFSKGPGRKANITLEPLVSSFAFSDSITLTVGRCRAGYLPNKTEHGHFTCKCMPTNNVHQGCTTNGTGIILRGGFWATNSSPEGDLAYHRCPWAHCKKYCISEHQVAYGSGPCCTRAPGHRGCLFDSTKPNMLCSSNRTGVMCGSCPKGTGIVHSQWNVDCEHCNHQPEVLIVMAVLPAAFALLLYLKDLHIPHYAWVFVHYIQVSSYLPNSNADKVFKVITYLQFYTSLDFLQGSCVFATMDALQNSGIFFIPLASVVLTLTVAYALSLLVKRQQRKKWLKRYSNAMLSCFQLMYFNLWVAVIRILLCVDIQFASGAQKHLLIDGSLRCWQGKHLSYGLPAALFTALVLVPAPFILFAYNRMAITNKSRQRRKSWFGYENGVGGIWWFSWDMVRKMAVVVGYGIFEVSLRQSVRFITFVVDLTLTCLTSLADRDADDDNAQGWWLGVLHCRIQSVSLVLLSVLQLLWVAFFITSYDPTVPIELLSTLESIPIVIMGLWLLWNLVSFVFRRMCKPKHDDSSAEEISWSQLLSTSQSRTLRDRLIHSLSKQCADISGRSRNARSRHDEDGYLSPMDSDVLLAGRAPDPNRGAAVSGGNDYMLSDSDSYDADAE